MWVCLLGGGQKMDGFRLVSLEHLPTYINLHTSILSANTGQAYAPLGEA